MRALDTHNHRHTREKPAPYHDTGETFEYPLMGAWKSLPP